MNSSGLLEIGSGKTDMHSEASRLLCSVSAEVQRFFVERAQEGGSGGVVMVVQEADP